MPTPADDLAKLLAAVLAYSPAAVGLASPPAPPAPPAGEMQVSLKS